MSTKTALDKKNSLYRRTVVHINWTMISLSVILCLLPLYKDSELWFEGNAVGVFSFLRANSTATTFDSAAVLSIAQDDQGLALFQMDTLNIVVLNGLYMGMAIPAALDLLLELHTTLTAKETADSAVHVVRLSWTERAVFVGGTFALGVVYFFPYDWNVMERSTMNFSFGAVNTVMTTAPILTFLARETSGVFTATWTTVLVTLVCVGSVLHNIAYMVSQPTLQQQLHAAGGYLLTIQAALTLATCLWSFVKYVRDGGLKLSPHDGDGNAKQTLEDDAETNAYKDFSMNKVPALHMLALTVNAIVNLCWFAEIITLIPNDIIYIFSTALVFVVETRIRQNEVLEGLHLLDSKRQFVRFIAHEIRTPLSSAVMGLELFKMAFEPPGGGDGGDTGGEGNERTMDVGELQEYLALVQESVKVAESIFDNLIEFDLHGHEKDTMVLRYEVSDAAELVTTVSAPLQLHARRSAVSLKVVQGSNDCGSGRSMVGVEVDRRRMAQALRALVAAAIDKTPKDGVVTVTVRPAAHVAASDRTDDTVSTKTPRRRSSLLDKPVPEPKKAKKKRFRGSIFASMTGTDTDVPARFVVVEIACGDPGFAKADAKRVNLDTFTFNPNELHGGGGGAGGGTQSGLGLSLAKLIVEAHGGRVFVSSVGVGKGSTFVVGLPISATTPLPPLPSSPSSPSHPQQSTTAAGENNRHSVSLGPYVDVGGWQRGSLRSSFDGSDIPNGSKPATPTASFLAPGATSKEPKWDGAVGAAIEAVKAANASSGGGRQSLLLTEVPVERPGGDAAAGGGDGGGSAADANKMPTLLSPRASALPPIVRPMVGPRALPVELAIGGGGGGGDGSSGKSTKDTARAPASAEVGLPTKPTLSLNLSLRSQTSCGGSSRDGGTARGATDGLHVLVVEDAPVARTVLVRLLKTMKCTADEAEDGQQAVDKVTAALADSSARLYDMILCDSVMPVMDGPTAVKLIRGLGYDGPILGVTGNTLPEQVADFLAHGADEVVGKPVKLPVLKAAMAHWSKKESGALTARKLTPRREQPEIPPAGILKHVTEDST